MKKLKNPLTLTGVTGVTLSNSGVGFDGTSPIDQSITVGNDISQSGNLQLIQLRQVQDITLGVSL